SDARDAKDTGTFNELGAADKRRDGLASLGRVGPSKKESDISLSGFVMAYRHRDM
ncbi:hypothetical protein KUCAC02_030496, partial [Chaenocephalus aceratus]